MIKKIVMISFGAVMRAIGKVFPYGVSQRLKSVRDMVYTLWIYNFLGDVGENSYFNYPLRLQGEGSRRIHIGARTCIGPFCVLGSWVHYGKDDHYEPEIIIGNDCNIGEFCHITAINRITIGDGLLTGRFVYIGDNSHGGLSLEESEIPPARRHLFSKGEIKIGRNVWIGDRVSVLGGVTVGHNVIIGAGSVVTHDIPDNCMVVGTPAKVIKILNV